MLHVRALVYIYKDALGPKHVPRDPSNSIDIGFKVLGRQKPRNPEKTQFFDFLELHAFRRAGSYNSLESSLNWSTKAIKLHFQVGADVPGS